MTSEKPVLLWASQGDVRCVCRCGIVYDARVQSYTRPVAIVTNKACPGCGRVDDIYHAAGRESFTVKLPSKAAP